MMGYCLFFVLPCFLFGAPGSSLSWWEFLGWECVSFLFFGHSSLGGGVCLLVSLLWCGLGSSWWPLFACLGCMALVLAVNSGVESSSQSSDRSVDAFFW